MKETELLKKQYMALAFNDFTFWSIIACLVMIWSGPIFLIMGETNVCWGCDIETTSNLTSTAYITLGYISIITGFLIGGMCIHRLVCLYCDYSLLKKQLPAKDAKD